MAGVGGAALRRGAVDVGDAGNVVRLQAAILDIAGGEGDREHDGLGAEHDCHPQDKTADQHQRCAGGITKTSTRVAP